MRVTLRRWFEKHLCDEILPRWLESAVRPNGFFHASLDREWRPVGPAEATLVSQGRLGYNFAAGYCLTGDERYLEATALGARFFLTHFTDQTQGGMFWSVGEDGSLLDGAKDAYGHAFALFFMAHCGRALKNQGIRELADTTLAVVRGPLTDDEGGLIPRLTRDLEYRPQLRTQNPVMHLFEALLAMLEVWGPNPAVSETAEDLARFVHLRLSSPLLGRLPEAYDENWRELAKEQGGRIDLGHSMEWAFLLSRGVELGLSERWLPVADKLLQYGLAVGEDPDGGLHSNQSPDGDLLPAEKGWWQQCELIRALIHFACVRKREDLWPKLEKHLEYVRSHFLDPEFGGWYGTPMQNGLPPRVASKGSVWKVDYHVVAMCEEALRVL